MSDTPEILQAKPVSWRKRPRGGFMKFLAAVLSVILCIAIFVSCVATVLILDIRAIVSKNGISRLVDLLIAGQSASAPARPALAVGVPASETSAGGMDMSGLLVDWAYDMISDAFGEDVEITKEQVQNFVQESTVKDFVAEKAAGLVEDFYAQESNTTITVEEITQLIEENKQVIEEQFGVQVDSAMLEQLDTTITESGILEPIEQEGLMDYIEKTLEPETPATQPAPDAEENSGGQSAPESGTVVTPSRPAETNPMAQVRQIMDLVRTATSNTAVAVWVGLLVILLLLLLLVHRFSLPATLSQAGSMVLLAGLLYSLPTALCLFAPALINSLLGEQAGALVRLFLSSASVVNFTVLGLGFAMIAAAVVVKIVASARKKKAQ